MRDGRKKKEKRKTIILKKINLVVLITCYQVDRKDKEIYKIQIVRFYKNVLLRFSFSISKNINLSIKARDMKGISNDTSCTLLSN